MNNILKGVAGIGLILYPFFVAYALAHGQYVWVSAVLIALGILDKSEPNLPEEGVEWTRQVTKVWCGFFCINAVIALITVFFAPMKIWVMYNGLISYVLMGGLLLGEFVLRKRQQRLHQAQK